MASRTTSDIPSSRGSTVAADEVDRDQGIMKLGSMFALGTDPPEEGIKPTAPNEEAEPLNRSVQENEWSDTPFCTDQFSNPRWRSYCRLSPQKVSYFLLPEHIDTYNDMLASFSPPGAPKNILLKQEPLNALADGRYSTLVLFQKVQYISIQTHEAESEKLKRKSKA